jgi:hypothetical protein
MSTRARALLILPALFLFALAGGWFAVGGSFWPEGRVHSVKVPDEVIAGRWRQAPNSRKDRTKQQIAQLEAIGYLAGYEPAGERGVKDRRERWRRAHLFPNGDVLAIYEGFGLVKIDKDSKSWSGPGSTRLTTTSR